MDCARSWLSLLVISVHQTSFMHDFKRKNGGQKYFSLTKVHSSNLQTQITLFDDLVGLNLITHGIQCQL